MNVKTSILRLLFVVALPPLSSTLKGDDSAPFTTLHSFQAVNNAQTKNLDGTYPSPELILAKDGNFYGTTSTGGPVGRGTIFRITPAGELSTVYNFSDFTDKPFGKPWTNAEGLNPESGLVQYTDGSFYGTTLAGGTYGHGTIFQLKVEGKPVATALHHFNTTDGLDCSYGLILAKDGNFYGATPNGGANGAGTIFKITPKGEFTSLYSFSKVDSGLRNADGSDPGRLVQGKDGGIYGTTQYGGTNGFGTIFKFIPGKGLTTLHVFTGKDEKGTDADGVYPCPSLIEGWDGDFYGTTQYGGTEEKGTIFRCTTKGKVSILENFTDATGTHPLVGLTEGFSEGQFYGSTSAGGANKAGTIYRIILRGQGDMIVEHSFEAITADYFNSPILVRNTDHNCYGTILYGGVNNSGSVFVINVVNPVIISATTVAGIVGQPFFYQIIATHKAYEFAVKPTLPAGLILDPKTGKITGTPKAAGTSVVTIMASTPLGSGTAKLTLAIKK